MSYKIKLKKKKGLSRSYILVIYDFRGKVLDIVGGYNKYKKIGNQVYKELYIDKDKFSFWINKGACMSKSILRLIKYKDEGVK